jgi:hypothetical protein
LLSSDGHLRLLLGYCYWLLLLLRDNRLLMKILSHLTSALLLITGLLTTSNRLFLSLLTTDGISRCLIPL